LPLNLRDELARLAFVEAEGFVDVDALTGTVP
jgi:hypothetical protein